MMYTIQERTIDGIMEWIELNLHLPLSIDYVSRRAGYSKGHLQRLFKYQVGITLGDYIRRRRLSRCADLLKATGRSIGDIVSEFSFSSHTNFDRQFKKVYGLTPKDFRNSEFA